MSLVGRRNNLTQPHINSDIKRIAKTKTREHLLRIVSYCCLISLFTCDAHTLHSHWWMLSRKRCLFFARCFCLFFLQKPQSECMTVRIQLLHLIRHIHYITSNWDLVKRFDPFCLAWLDFLPQLRISLRINRAVTPWKPIPTNTFCLSLCRIALMNWFSTPTSHTLCVYILNSAE